MRELGPQKLLLTLLAALLVAFASCGGNAGKAASNSPTPSGSTAASSYDVCNCTPTEDASNDYRHAAKHVPIPSSSSQDITVSDILGWAQDTASQPDAPRSGRELQVFHIATAYLQNIYINPGDCDIHFEISDTPDPSAPRVIVETPMDSEYCPSRLAVQRAIAARGLSFPLAGDLTPPLTVDVVGLAFEDFGHTRGSPQVSTVWELHPATVTITGQ